MVTVSSSFPPSVWAPKWNVCTISRGVEPSTRRSKARLVALALRCTHAAPQSSYAVFHLEHASVELFSGSNGSGGWMSAKATVLVDFSWMSCRRAALRSLICHLISVCGFNMTRSMYDSSHDKRFESSGVPSPELLLFIVHATQVALVADILHPSDTFSPVFKKLEQTKNPDEKKRTTSANPNVPLDALTTKSKKCLPGYIGRLHHMSCNTQKSACKSTN